MDKLKQWVALTLVGALAIMAAGWALLISPKRSEANDLRAQAAEQASANAMLTTQIDVLKAKSQKLPTEQARLASVAAKIPSDPGLPNLVRALLNASRDANVELVSVVPGPPAVVAPAAPGAAAAPGAPAAPETGQVAPVAPPAPNSFGQLASIPVSINVVGEYFRIAKFVASLETLPRAYRVNNLTMSPGTSPTAGKDAARPDALVDGRSLNTTISGTVYMTTERATASSTSSAAPPAAAPPAAVQPPTDADN